MSEAPTSTPLSSNSNVVAVRPQLPDPMRRNWTWLSLQWIFQFLFTIWFRYRAFGMENLPEGGALLLINHQSFLDPLLVGLPLTRPVSYLARENLFRLPIIGWLVKNTYVMPISRESAGTESLRESIRRMEHGFLVGIFPEGTRTEDGGLCEMKPGFVALIRRVKVPVIPVGIAGAFEAFPRGAWFPVPARIRIVFGRPMESTRLVELCQKGREAELVDWSRTQIQECLDQANALREDRPPRPH